MGLFKERVRLCWKDRTADVKLLVSAGASYTTIPSELADRLNVLATPEVEIEVLADEKVKKIRARGSYLWIEIRGFRKFGGVLFTDDIMPILGALTLELFGAVVDPVKRELRIARPGPVAFY